MCNNVHLAEKSSSWKESLVWKTIKACFHHRICSAGNSSECACVIKAYATVNINTRIVFFTEKDFAKADSTLNNTFRNTLLQGKHFGDWRKHAKQIHLIMIILLINPCITASKFSIWYTLWNMTYWVNGTPTVPVVCKHRWPQENNKSICHHTTVNHIRLSWFLTPVAVRVIDGPGMAILWGCMA